MNTLEILGLILASALGIATALFRKYYMPPVPSLDNLDTFPPEDYIPATPPPIMAPNKPLATTTPPITNPTETKYTPTIDDLCLLIRDYEGWILPGGKDWAGKVYPRGSRSYQNCSPGNVKYSPVGYLPMYGKVGKDEDGFAIFRDKETGMLYLRNMIDVQIKKNPNQTLLQFMSRYAPKSENDTVSYASFIAKRLGIDMHTPMKTLLT